MHRIGEPAHIMLQGELSLLCLAMAEICDDYASRKIAIFCGRKKRQLYRFARGAFKLRGYISLVYRYVVHIFDRIVMRVASIFRYL